MKYDVVLLSGGTGKRMHNETPKQYLQLAGKPMIMHVLEKIAVLKDVEKIIIVCKEEYISQISTMLEQFGMKKPVEYAIAGDSRQASVLSGLKKVNTDKVLIHEAARPFVKASDFQKLIDDPAEDVIFGTGIYFTVTKGYEFIEGILDRNELVNVQLPQKFNTKSIVEAHRKAKEEGLQFTEDASLLFYYNPGKKVKILKGEDYNIKITTRMDLLMGEIIYDEVFRRRK